MATIATTNTQIYAYDLALNAFKQGQVTNEAVFNQSIESILMTAPTWNIFNIPRGSALRQNLFENLSEGFMENLMDKVAQSIATYETRITVLTELMQANINMNEHSVTIVIPYIIKATGVITQFKKKAVE